MSLLPEQFAQNPDDILVYGRFTPDQSSNSLRFGLTTYLYSEDLERAWALADKLEFGAVGINVSDTSELQAPFGGWKLSGVGRELGIEGLETFLEPKHVKIRVTPYRRAG